MYLAKIAMDIVAKHMKPNEIGVRMASLDEISYRKILWEHKPLTSFWRVGKGIAKKLEENGMYTMGDVALMSIKNEKFLYNLFGVNAELLIDHAWGYEPTKIEDVKKYSKYICKTEIKNLDVIPSGIVPPNPSELLGSEKTKELV